MKNLAITSQIISQTYFVTEREKYLIQIQPATLSIQEMYFLFLQKVKILTKIESIVVDLRISSSETRRVRQSTRTLTNRTFLKK